jgi:hypothetical protein
MPRGRVTPKKLADAASGLAQVAARYKDTKDTFVAAGFGTDFLDQLISAANALPRRGGRSHQDGARVGAVPRPG